MPIAEDIARRFRNPDARSEAYLALVKAVDKIDSPLENRGLVAMCIINALRAFVAEDTVISRSYKTVIKKPLQREELDELCCTHYQFDAVDFLEYLDLLELDVLDKLIISYKLDDVSNQTIANITGYCRNEIAQRIKLLKIKMKGLLDESNMSRVQVAG